VIVKKSHVRVLEFISNGKTGFFLFPDGRKSNKFCAKETGLQEIDRALRCNEIEEDEASILRGMLMRSGLPSLEEVAAHLGNEVINLNDPRNFRLMGPGPMDRVH
jgi:hypothetical protein